MAEHEMVVTFKWENGNYFLIKTKKDEDDAVVDVRVEENAKIEVIWSAIQSACISRVNQILSDIGKEMKT